MTEKCFIGSANNRCTHLSYRSASSSSIERATNVTSIRPVSAILCTRDPQFAMPWTECLSTRTAFLGNRISAARIVTSVCCHSRPLTSVTDQTDLVPLTQLSDTGIALKGCPLALFPQQPDSRGLDGASPARIPRSCPTPLVTNVRLRAREPRIPPKSRSVKTGKKLLGDAQRPQTGMVSWVSRAPKPHAG